MKKIPFVVTAVALSAASHAAEFTLRYTDISDLVASFNALDGYEHSVDQGPGNPAKVVREPYKFSSDTRAKLGADRAVLVKALNAFMEKLADLRLKISGDRDKIDEKNPAQMGAWKKESGVFQTMAVTLDLSPITAAELVVNDNPIPISVLSTLNLLRPVQK